MLSDSEKSGLAELAALAAMNLTARECGFLLAGFLAGLEAAGLDKPKRAQFINRHCPTPLRFVLGEARNQAAQRGLIPTLPAGP